MEVTMTMKNVKEQIRLLQETLEQAKRQIHNAEHNIYREITSHDIEALKEKCMGDDPIEFLGRENGVYVDTRHYGYWMLDQQTNEWTRLGEQ
jgi:hypothetical protein